MRALSLFIVTVGIVGALGVEAEGQLAVSIGIRETNSDPSIPIGGNGGAAGGIEYVNLDGQTLPLDGNWHLFTFNFQNDPLTAFAGATANATYDGTRGVLEMIRFRNIAGETAPIRLWIDDITNTGVTGAPTNFGSFEGAAVGSEVIFQEPRFSGSTSANLMLTPNSSLVTDAVAFSGTQSNEVNFQFLDATDTRWVRLTTFNTPNMPNPVIEFPNGSSLTFRVRGVVVPEPACLSLLGLAALSLAARRR
jgi:hypothetical protein